MKEEYSVLFDEERAKPSEYSAIVEYGLSSSDIKKTETGSILNSFKYETPLSSDLDIFVNLADERIQSMPRVSKFLNELRLSIANNSSNLKTIHFNKLSLEESSRPGELMIDWIYNFFRAFFSFDDNEGDMYGLIVNNTETKVFQSEFEPLKESDYDEVAAKSVRFITENILR